MEFLQTIFFFIIIIGFLVFVHELGHFTAAKLSKVGVKEFAIGFGPNLLQREYKGTKYSLKLLPLGGFVQLEGEEDKTKSNGFRAQPFYKKFFILSAGVIMNFITAVIFLFITLQTQDYRIPITNFADYDFNNVDRVDSFYPVSIIEIDEDWGWEGLEDTDTIVAINGEEIESPSQFNNLIEQYQGENVEVSVIDLDTFEVSNKDIVIGNLYKGEYFPIEVNLMENSRSEGQLESGEVIVGISGKRFRNLGEFQELLDQNQGKTVNFEFINFENDETASREVRVNQRENGTILDARLNYSYGIDVSYGNTDRESYFITYKENLISPVAFAVDMVVYQIKGLSNIISDAVETGDYEEVSQSVGGPVALGSQVNDVVEYEIYDAFFFLVALISLSLAVFNIIPFPALDGGQIVIALIESIRRKQLSDDLISKINLTGFAILMFLSLLITIKDLNQFDVISDIGETISNIFGQ